MSRLIDADALIKAMNEDYTFYGFVDLLKDIHVIIDEAPTIDAVSVVRCKECKYKDMEICAMHRLVVAGVRKSDDYCSYGEREGE